MNEYREPRNYEELVQMITAMEYGDYVENDDTGHLRVAEVTNMCGGKYLMFEDREVCGLTSDVEEVAKFIAEGWEY